ncbi:MAG: hypothetical protein PHP50_09880 [Lachnospiraceae bacterium]|nr:hypothetical protein [Lachnospiraceae bacterium]
MTNLLEIKEYLKYFYNKNEVYIQPAFRFLMALVCLVSVNVKLGYMTRLNNIAIVLIVSLLCSFLPFGFIMAFSALFVLLHLYALSMECAAVVFGLMLVMYLLYFRFCPKDTLAVLLTPLLFAWRIPYVMPLAMGLIAAPTSCVSVGCGVIIYYTVDYIAQNATVFNQAGSEAAASNFRYVIDGVMGNKNMLIMLVAFVITIILVYTLRRMSMDHSWTIAMVAGSLTDIVVILIGDLIYDTNVSVLGAIIGTILSVVIVMALKFFTFNVDYSRTEHVQFEDDEYYYYVKAIPKMTVTTPTKTVKKINTQKREPLYERDGSRGRETSRSREAVRDHELSREREMTRDREVRRRSVNRDAASRNAVEQLRRMRSMDDDEE